MVNPITSIRPPVAPEAVNPRVASGAGFAGALSQAIENVNASQVTSQSATMRFLNGESEDLHTVALEQQRASIAFDLALQVRNKVVSAYQEIMRMPV